MLVLFDHGTPRTLARYLIDLHAVTESRAGGWERVENGDDGQEPDLSAEPQKR